MLLHLARNLSGSRLLVLNLEHTPRHGVTPGDVHGVRHNQPRFYDARPGYEGVVMLGPNQAGRFLHVAMVELEARGLLQVITTYWFERRPALKLYLLEAEE
jgi:hypothetical protein